MRPFLVGFTFCAATCLLVVRANAESMATQPNEDAKRAFVRGVALTEASSWADALEAFERAQALSPHPITLYNLALCHRALGHVIRASDLLDKSLGGPELPPAIRQQALKLREDLSTITARVRLRMSTDDVFVSVDGHGLEARGEMLYKSDDAAARSTRMDVREHTMVLDPGRHVVTFTRPGFEARAEDMNLEPGSTRSITIALEELASVVAVESTPSHAQVAVNRSIKGWTPLTLTVPSGHIEIRVTKDGFDPFVTNTVALPGQQARIVAPLAQHRTPVTKSWWFYAIVGASIAVVGVATYVLLRPAEDGGTLNWVVR